MNPKTLLLQATLSNYNVPVFNILAQNVDLTVAYTIKNECKENVLFKIKKLNYIKFGSLIFIKNGFHKMCSQFDVIIFLTDLHYVSYCYLPFISREYKVIPWTIGIRASYKKRYDLSRKKDFIDRIYGRILSRSDAIIFYMKEPLKFWGEIINKEKVFIAHNTVDVLTNLNDESKQKNRIIFIGTLYKEKKIYELINAFIEAKNKCNVNDFPCLDIIGEGYEYENLKKLIEKHKLTDSINLCGAIFDKKELAKYFSKALLCISPDQAGLSVLVSMGHGVPFVTRTDAITGGERMNIIDKKNGQFYNNQKELTSIIEETCINPGKYIEMGKKAQEYYRSNATIKHMAQGFIDAIQYTLK